MVFVFLFSLLVSHALYSPLRLGEGILDEAAGSGFFEIKESSPSLLTRSDASEAVS